MGLYGPQQLKRKAAFEVDIHANSLDVHLVFYLGYLTAKHLERRFVVLAKDIDYDPPLAHARTLAFSIEHLPLLTGSSSLHRRKEIPFSTRLAVLARPTRLPK